MNQDLELGYRVARGVDPEGWAPYTLPVSAYDRGAHYLGPPGTGKTCALLCTVQEIIERVPDATVFYVCPKGPGANKLVRWCYERALDDRVLPINPNDRRRVCGFNPVRPWPDNHELQARVARELFLRAVGQSEALLTPRQSRWLDNLTYALIKLNLTLAEALLLFSYSTNEYRRALVPLLPEGPVRSDFEWLLRVADLGSQGQMMKILDEHLGAAVNRLRHVLGNPAVRAMYGAVRSIDIRQVCNEPMIVPVDLQTEQLDREAQRLLGLQLINEITREVLQRRPHEFRPLFLVVDEASLFVSLDLVEALDLGREPGLRVVLAHQYLGQLKDSVTGDRRMLDAVLSDIQLKVIFGRLGPDDAHEIARVLHGHHLNADKRREVSRSPRQLQQVVTARSRTRGTSQAIAHSETNSHTEADGESVGESTARAVGTGRARGTSTLSGTGSAMGSLSGTSASHALAHDAALQIDATTDTTSAMDASSHLESDFSGQGETESTSEFESEAVGTSSSLSHVVADGVTVGTAATAGSSESVAEGPMVVPGPVFLEPQVEFEPLDVQLWRHEAEIIKQPDRHAIVAFGKEAPVAIYWRTLRDPTIDQEQAAELTLERMRSRPEYSEPAEVEAEIAARHRRLLSGYDSRAQVLDECPSREELERNLDDAGIRPRSKSAPEPDEEGEE